MIPYYSPNLGLWKFLRSLGTGNSAQIVTEHFREITGKKFILLTSSCRSALYLAYQAAEEKGGVLTSPLTCTAAIDPIIHSGNTPVYMDISPESLNMDPAAIPALPDTVKYIQIVHFGGLPVQMEKFLQLADQKKLMIIEDCAQSYTAVYKGKNTGSFGFVSCFSLIKNAYGIGGGILATDDEELFRKVEKMQDELTSFNKKLILFRIIRNIIESKRRFRLGEFIYTRFMAFRDRSMGSGEIEDQAAFMKNVRKPHPLFFKIFAVQLRSIKKLHGKRLTAARQIISGCKEMGIKFTNTELVNDDSKPSYTKLYFHIPEITAPDNLTTLTEKGIEVKHLEHKYGSVYQTPFNKMKAYQGIGLEKCEQYFKVHDHLVSVPVYEQMKASQIKMITAQLKRERIDG